MSSNQLNVALRLSAVGSGALAEAIGKIGASFERVRQQITAATAVQTQLGQRIQALGGASRAPAVLREQYERLKASIEKATSATEKLAAAQARVEKHASAIAQLKADAFAVVGMATTLGLPVKAAVDFESAMADVRKVVDGTDAEINALADAIKRMGREIPLAHTEIAALAAAGGQLGVKLADLPQFVSTTAKMSVAFDMPAQEAGDAMAKIANVYAIPIREIDRLGDAINQISNESPAKASEIVRALSRVGGVARQFGLSAEQAAALSGALIAMGKAPEVAATGINALLIKLSTADKQGKQFQEGLAAIGVSASALKRAIDKDAQGALLAFLQRLEKLPQQQRMGVLTDLFGLEYADDIAALAGSLDVYRQQLAAVRSSAGSMGKEFAARAATTANNWTLLKNTLNELAIEIGSALLPAVKGIMASIRPAIESVAAWARANQPLVESIGKIAGAILLFKAGSLAARFAFHSVAYVVSSLGVAFSRLRLILSSVGLAWRVLTVTWIPWLKSALVGLFMWAQVALVPAIKAVGAAIAAVGRAVLLNPIGLALTAIAGAAYLIWRNWDAIGPRLAAVWQGVKAAFASAWEWISGLPGRMLAIGRQIIDGLLAGMRERWAALKEGVSNIGSNISDWFKDKLGIRSPSRVFAELGGHLMGGLQLGIERASSLPLAAMRTVAGALAVPMAAGAMALGSAGAATAGGMPAAPIQITVNLNGPATPDAAQDVAAAVRREVERALAEAGRREQLARRAALIDGGMA